MFLTKTIRVCLADQLAISVPSTSILENHPGEVAFAPNKPALSDGVKIVECQLRISRKDGDTMRPNPGANVGKIAHAAGRYAALSAKEQQLALCNLYPANRSSFIHSYTQQIFCRSNDARHGVARPFRK
jgi:hypothetical protein